MGFVAKVLNGESGIQLYYIIGVLIFITLFVIIVFRTLRIPKNDLKNFKNSILDNTEYTKENN